MTHSAAYLRTLRRAAIPQAVTALVKTRRRCTHEMVLMTQAVVCKTCGANWTLEERER